MKTVETMEIKDKTGRTFLKFSDFEIVSTNKQVEQVFVSFTFWISVGSINSTFELEAELSDFEEMLNHLEILNQDLNRTFYFQHSDDRLKIKFTPNKAGIIGIEGTAAEIDYSAKIEFKFETDQTFLEKLINQCKVVISKIRIESLNR